MSDLAIVIPAYKENFFCKTLQSLAQQSNKNFTVYVGDDCSPFDLCSIVNKYANLLNIQYTRFKDNIGAKNLVYQWERCIKLTSDEEWLCLFSDDDLMDENCIENFYRTIKKHQGAFDVYRFNTVVIDKDGDIIYSSPIGPEIETSEQMAYHLLKGQRGNSMPDHIFSRKVYESCGLVFTEYAQGADWATSILFSRQKGICLIPGNIYWRYSGINITSVASANRHTMINGHLQFATWILDHFKYLKAQPSNITYDMIVEATGLNLKTVLKYHYKGFNWEYTFDILNFYHKRVGLSYYITIKELLDIEEDYLPVIKKTRYFISRVQNKLRRLLSRMHS